jgi:methyl-accepting chemotaxis protein
MSIRKLSFVIFAVILLSAVVLAALTALLVSSGERLLASTEQRYQSYLLANELRQSSDDLTRLARTYVVTGDAKYEKMYWDVLAVRNGEGPRLDGRMASLKRLMQEAGFTQQEFALLDESQNNSDGLVTTETIAMNAVKGLYDDGSGNYVVRREPDLEMSRRIMHDRAYHLDKDRIMNPIDRFADLLDSRTRESVESNRKGTDALLLAIQIVVVLLVALSLAGGYVAHRKIVRPTIAMQQQIERVSKGDLNVQIAGALPASEIRSDNELSRLAIAIRDLVSYMEEMAEAADQLAQGDLTVTVEPHSEADVLAHSFREMAAKLREMFIRLETRAEGLSRASQDLSSVSEQVAANVAGVSANANSVSVAAEQMSANMDSVSVAADQSTDNIGTVATSTEEMTATIAEIARNTERSRQIAGAAVTTVESAAHRVEDLGAAAQSIGKVIEVIVEIAEQTKLLALNATIEAASAGDAGKGFAVVAGEVKELARQTGEATEEIRTSIEQIQESTREAVSEMNQIQGVIGEVNEGVASVATAVEEQSVTTRDIARNVGQAAAGVQSVMENVGQAATVSTSIAAEIGAVNSASSQVSQAVDQVSRQAQSLASMGAELKEMVDQFKTGEKGA